MLTKTLLGMSVVAGLIAGAASAETQAMAWTDLNMRDGPSPMHSIVDVIPANNTVMVQGCLADASWCQVSHGETTGWAAGNYLTTSIDNEPVALASGDKRVVLTTVTYDNEQVATAGGLATGAIAGALVAGPVGAVVGAIVGGAVGASVELDPTVVTYVKSNPVDPIYLDGEVVVGAGIPDAVMLAPVPDSTYEYAYLNGVLVLVDTKDRKVVHIVR
ncbi:MAG: DUF1236 domain-containing protein [Pseudodonghicola sp.]|nr:DUF1236 domain-containing protein [Pseudodonghicola sp.]